MILPVASFWNTSTAPKGRVHHALAPMLVHSQVSSALINEPVPQARPLILQPPARSVVGSLQPKNRAHAETAPTIVASPSEMLKKKDE
jgi:hypothetical protein